jgi:hypothetical protein
MLIVYTNVIQSAVLLGLERNLSLWRLLSGPGFESFTAMVFWAVEEEHTASIFRDELQC